MIKFWVDKNRLGTDNLLYNNSRTNEIIYIINLSDRDGWTIMKVNDVKIGIDFLNKGFSYV